MSDWFRRWFTNSGGRGRLVPWSRSYAGVFVNQLIFAALILVLGGLFSWLLGRWLPLAMFSTLSTMQAWAAAYSRRYDPGVRKK